MSCFAALSGLISLRLNMETPGEWFLNIRLEHGTCVLQADECALWAGLQHTVCTTILPFSELSWLLYSDRRGLCNVGTLSRCWFSTLPRQRWCLVPFPATRSVVTSAPPGGSSRTSAPPPPSLSHSLQHPTTICNSITVLAWNRIIDISLSKEPLIVDGPRVWLRTRDWPSEAIFSCGNYTSDVKWKFWNSLLK